MLRPLPPSPAQPLDWQAAVPAFSPAESLSDTHMHTCTRRGGDRQKAVVGGSPPHRSAQRAPVLTQRECAPLGSCLVGGGERTHSLRTQAHRAIIILISGGLGKLEEGGGAGWKRNRGMATATGRGPWFSGLRLHGQGWALPMETGL